MNFAATLGWTMLGAFLVATLSIPLGIALHDTLRAATTRGRRLLWALLLTPLFTPTLLTGYAYGSFSLSLVHLPLLNVAWYLLLLTFKFLAVGTLVLHCAPPPAASDSAVHCARLLSRSTRRLNMWTVLWHSRLRNTVPLFVITFLLVFQEFELSSLLVTENWTVWLFDAQALGLSSALTWRYAAAPVLIQTFLLTAGLAALPALLAPTVPLERPARLPPLLHWATWIIAYAAVTAVTLLPLCVVVSSATDGLIAVLQDQRMLRELMTALGFGFVSGLTATALSCLLNRRKSTRSRVAMADWFHRTVLWMLVLPGLWGALVVSLAVRSLFQVPPFRLLYDTPLPALIALTLFLVPRAFILQRALLTASRPPAAHTAHLLLQQHASEGVTALNWNLRYHPAFLMTAILCLWGYLELTPVAMLAPPGINSIPVRLYNQMHFGRGTIVSGVLLLSLIAPGLLFSCGLFAGRRLLHRLHRRLSSPVRALSSRETTR